MFTAADLRRVARRIMSEHHFRVDFSAPVLSEVGRAAEPAFELRPERDLSGLLWSSIDNDDSRDLDQLEFLQTDPRGARLFIAIANVDAFVPKNSATDRAAAENTTSIYTGVQTFPLLPERLSTDLSSLVEGKKRLSVVIELLIAPDGAPLESTVYPAVVQNKAQLTYDAVAQWLEGPGPSADSPLTVRILDKIKGDPALQEQLRLQDELAQKLEKRRHEAGALTFGTTELRPSVSSAGEVELRVHRRNRATELIENFMIAANGATVAFLQRSGFPILQRVVRTPKRWDRIVTLAQTTGARLPAQPDVKALQAFLLDQQRKNPDHFADLSLAVIKLLGRGEYVVEHANEPPLGHFGLAVENYSHSTAPNRRYPDLLTQRLLLAAAGGQPSSAAAPDLDRMAAHCTLQEDEANKVERAVRKCVAAVALSSRIGEEFPALVTGASEKGVWIRVDHPPVEGKLVGSLPALDVGDKVRVRLLSTNPERGFIDFQLQQPRHS